MGRNENMVRGFAAARMAIRQHQTSTTHLPAFYSFQNNVAALRAEIDVVGQHNAVSRQKRWAEAQQSSTDGCLGFFASCVGAASLVAFAGALGTPLRWGIEPCALIQYAQCQTEEHVRSQQVLEACGSSPVSAKARKPRV